MLKAWGQEVNLGQKHCHQQAVEKRPLLLGRSEDCGSGSGQERRFDPLAKTSGLPQSADVLGVRRHVSSVP